MLKLYVWEGVLCDYTDGVAFALANTAEEAAEMVRASGVSDRWNGVTLEGVQPKEYDAPIGFYLYGGG